MTTVAVRPQVEAFVAALRAVPNLTVHVGVVPPAPVPPGGGPVAPVTPYVVVFPDGGLSDREELVVVSDRLEQAVRVTCVGKTASEVLWAVERVRGAVLDARLTVAGRRAFPVSHESSSALLRDDDVTPPLLYISDVYRLSTVAG